MGEANEVALFVPDYCLWPESQKVGRCPASFQAAWLSWSYLTRYNLGCKKGATCNIKFKPYFLIVH